MTEENPNTISEHIVFLYNQTKTNQEQILALITKQQAMIEQFNRLLDVLKKWGEK